MIGQLKQRWSKNQQILHWLIFSLIVVMILLGFYSNSMLSKDPQKYLILLGHQGLGCIVLLLAVVRIIWYTKARPLKQRSSEAPWLEYLADFIHFLLRLIVLTLPLLGIVLSFADPFVWPFTAQSADLTDQRANIAELSHSFHYLGAWVLIILIVLHVMGAVRYRYKNG